MRLLCIAETTVEMDAAEKVFAEWPTPIVIAGPDIGEALPFPGDSIDKDFGWSTAHPVVDAYRAYKPMPYDAPSCAMGAMLYAVHPNDGYFKLSDAGAGKPRHLVLDPDQKARIIRTYVEIASAKPVPRKPRHPVDEKKEEEKKKEPAK